MRQKERELAAAVSAFKSTSAQSVLIKKQKLSTDTSVMGYEKMNDLVAELREVQAKNEALTTDARSFHRINGEQNKELQNQDAAKNYAGKMKGLMKELSQANAVIKDLNEKSKEVIATQKQLR